MRNRGYLLGFSFLGEETVCECPGKKGSFTIEDNELDPAADRRVKIHSRNIFSP